MRWKGLATNLLLTGGALVVASLAGEVVLRVFPPSTLPTAAALADVRLANPPRLMILDPEIGWVMAPNFEGRARGREFDITIRTNSEGLRDREFDLSSPARRVVVVGDSYAFGFGVEAEEAFAKVAERDLRSAGETDVEVVNGGVSGYGPCEEAAMAGRLVPIFRPRAVVMAFFEGNDLRNALDFPMSLVMGEDGYLHGKRMNAIRPPASFLLTYLAGKADNLVEKARTGRAIEIAEKAIEQARDIARRSGASFLLALIPAGHAQRVSRSGVLRAYDRMLGVPGDVCGLMEEYARRSGIDVINLAPIFDAESDENLYRFPSDRHFTREGHRLAGSEIAKALRPLLRAGRAEAAP